MLSCSNVGLHLKKSYSKKQTNHDSYQTNRNHLLLSPSDIPTCTQPYSSIIYYTLNLVYNMNKIKRCFGFYSKI